MKVSTFEAIQRFLNISGRDFAQRLGITPFHLSRIKSGKGGALISRELGNKAIEALKAGLGTRKCQADLAFILSALAHEGDLGPSTFSKLRILTLLGKSCSPKDLAQLGSALAKIGNRAAQKETCEPHPQGRKILSLIRYLERAGIDTATIFDPAPGTGEAQAFIAECLMKNKISPPDLARFKGTEKYQEHEEERREQAKAIAAILSRHHVSPRAYLVAKGYLGENPQAANHRS